MKKELLNPSLILTSALATTLLTGCTSMNGGSYSGMDEPVNTLAYTAVTDSKELVKWTGSHFGQLSMRSMDTYYFRVPDTGFGGTGVMTMDQTGTRSVRSSDIDRADAQTRYPSGIDTAPAPYEANGGYKIIRHQPGNAR